MRKLDRYLFADFAQSFAATLIVLLVVSLGGVMVDLLGNIADGRLPARLLLSQLGLQFLVYLPLILPLALMLGLLLALARLYRDSEMPVLAAIGVGPRRILRPLLGVVVPVVGLVAVCSLWLGPWADRTSERLIEHANRSLLVAGLDAGRFTALPNGAMVYLGGVSSDGTQLSRVFMHQAQNGRVDVVTARTGRMYFEGDRDRYLRLEDGFRIEGPEDGDDLDYRLMRYEGNVVALPDREARERNDPELLPTLALLHDARPQAVAQLHSRIAPPLLALAFALLTLPLARSAPRQQRYGRILLGFLGYLVGTNLMFVGTQALADGRIPAAMGLWWLTLPLVLGATWLYLRDGRLGRPRRAR